MPKLLAIAIDKSSKNQSYHTDFDARGLEGFSPYDGAENGPALTREAKERPTARFDAAEGSTGLAADTGGVIVENTNDLAKGLARLQGLLQPPPEA